MSSLIRTQGDSPLIAVMPPGMAFQSEREYVILQLHETDCLSRVTIYCGDNQRKQLAFCPYCGVMYENTVTAYGHVRKHLGITFLCGGCYNKIYRAPQHLIQHRRNCSPCLMSKPEEYYPLSPPQRKQLPRNAHGGGFKIYKVALWFTSSWGSWGSQVLKPTPALHLPDELNPLLDSFTPLIMCSKVGTFSKRPMD